MVAAHGGKDHFYNLRDAYIVVKHQTQDPASPTIYSYEKHIFAGEQSAIQYSFESQFTTNMISTFDLFTLPGKRMPPEACIWTKLNIHPYACEAEFHYYLLALPFKLFDQDLITRSERKGGEVRMQLKYTDRELSLAIDPETKLIRSLYFHTSTGEKHRVDFKALRVNGLTLLGERRYFRPPQKQAYKIETIVQVVFWNGFTRQDLAPQAHQALAIP